MYQFRFEDFKISVGSSGKLLLVKLPISGPTVPLGNPELYDPTNTCRPTVGR